MADDRKGDGDRRPVRGRPERGRPEGSARVRSGPAQPGRAQPGRPQPGRAQPGRPQPGRAQSRRASDAESAPRENSGPAIPATVEAKQLAPEIRAELFTLDKSTADTIARHLVAAGELLDSDPEAALAHAQAARTRSGRIAAIREAVGIAAYYCGDWAQALAEFRAARRMGSKSQLLPLIADCERGVGRPEKAIELARGPEAAELTGDDADELRIVAAGARVDLGQLEQALALLSSPPPDPSRTGSTAARLLYAYAEILLALGRSDDARQWFVHAATADLEGDTDAEDRIEELAPGDKV
ncbi:tetratricopeptide repeat protein [Mycolicibacterium sp.]|uniref:tetratricopeptide repeat protein n=1 Tax=Mycolicibacterium sp. TaxID=2320850 RepID=UPI001A20035F|nr:tetratricopeptide repeat protein [Mycolicibacterium sp.]MBJ7401531.1 tetratricopeptide repeat protein [Mycolicibacterium sp.]